MRRTIPRLDVGLTDAVLMRQIGLLVRERIQARTADGRDIQGRFFRAYSARYAARKAKELGAGHVNLTVSGNMLRNLQVVVDGDGKVTIRY